MSRNESRCEGGGGMGLKEERVGEFPDVSFGREHRTALQMRRCAREKPKALA